MGEYRVTWITDQLAVGYAPMSYDDLDVIRSLGIDSIVNLCGEYCDLHDIESQSGFDVCYLPIMDDRAPDLEELERGLAWLDEAIYLGKKVLVHCRHGIGRTGTFVTSYLLRKGFGLKLAEKQLKSIDAKPTSFFQWRLLRKMNKKERMLTIREPSLEWKNVVDLAPFFGEYEQLVAEVESSKEDGGRSEQERRSGCEEAPGCHRPVNLHFIEAAYLSHSINKKLKQEERTGIIERAAAASRHLKVQAEPGGGAPGYSCPLCAENMCIVFPFRPLLCRFDGLPGDVPLRAVPAPELPAVIDEHLSRMSQEMFFALNSSFLGGKKLIFPLAHVVSGKFVQDYFHFLMSNETA